MTVVVAQVADINAAIAKIKLTIGTVTTLAATAKATATITGTSPNFVLNLGIPQGKAGPAGPTEIGPLYPQG